jgi:hypothetical protein
MQIREREVYGASGGARQSGSLEASGDWRPIESLPISCAHN